MALRKYIGALGAALVAALGAGHAAADGQHLPPIGQRQYLLGEGDHRAAPVIIQSVHRSTDQRYMRDPDQPGHIKLRPLPPRAVAKRQVVKEKPGSLRFRRLQVAGHLQQPRIDFTLAPLPLERTDEPVGADFFPKVFAPAADDAF